MPAILGALARGSKGSLFFVAWDMMFFYIICAQLISPKVKKGIVLSGAIVILLLLLGSTAIQSGRNDLRGGKTSVEEVFIRYLGESMPNVGWEVYDKVKWHPNGRRFYPEFFGSEGDKSKLSHEDWHYYWGAKIGVPVEKFHTFWGDSYMEFGLINSLIYVFLIALLWDKFVFKYSNNISWIPLVAFYYKFFIIWGVFGHGGFSGSRRHVLFIYLIIVCIIINTINKKNVAKERKIKAKFSPISM